MSDQDPIKLSEGPGKAPAPVQDARSASSRAAMAKKHVCASCGGLGHSGSICSVTAKELELWIPVRTRNPTNGAHGHWSVTAEMRKRVRRTTDLAWLEAGLQHRIQPVLRITLTRVSPRALDDDNLRPALKSVRDAVAMRLRADDATPLIRWEYQQTFGREMMVRVLIERA
jgi:hypothetical protein